MAAKKSGEEAGIRVPESALPRVVVVGGGFAGNEVVRRLAGAPYQVVQIDANNFHQFQPLLYQVASCGLEPDGIIFPLRKLVRDQENVRFRMATVERVDPVAKCIHTDQGALGYDHLVLATGSTSNFFGNAELEEGAIGMKDIREALDIRSRILTNLEQAASTEDEADREALTNVVIVGGGPAGVEMAGALAEFRAHILEKDYPDLLREHFRIVIVQSGDRLLKGMSLHAANRSRRDLEELGVELVFGNRVSGYRDAVVSTKSGLEIPAGTLIWTAGVKGQFPEGIKPDAVVGGNRINVNPDLSIAGHEGMHRPLREVAPWPAPRDTAPPAGFCLRLLHPPQQQPGQGALARGSADREALRKRPSHRAIHQ